MVQEVGGSDEEMTVGDEWLHRRTPSTGEYNLIIKANQPITD